MNFRQLKYFIALAEELNFRAASNRVHIAQSALTRQLQQLEQVTNSRLLNRDRRHVELTPAGEVFLAHARHILSQYNRAVMETKRRALGESNGLRVAFVSSVSHVIVPTILKDVRKKYPDCDFDLQELSSDQQITDLMENKIDIGILRPRRSLKSVQYHSMLIEPFVVVVPEDHRLANKRNVELKEFADEPFIMHSGIHDAENTTIHSLSLDLLRRSGIDPEITNVSSNHMATAMGLVKAGFGISLVPRSIMLHSVSGIAFTTLKESQPTSELGLARRHNETNPVCHAFVQVALEVAERLF